MQPLAVQQVDARLFEALGVVGPRTYQPVLSSTVVPVVVLPLDTFDAGTPVSIVDTGFARVIAGQAFLLYGSCAAVAGQFAHVQLFNLATNLRLVVQQFWVSSGVAGGFYMTTNSAALAVAGNFGANKLANGVASSSRAYSQNAAARIGSAGYPFLDTLARSPSVIKPTDPIVLNPGAGLIISHGAVNADIGASFEYYEASI